MIYVLSLLPIAILVVVSLLKGVREAVLAGLVVTTALFFYWGATFNHFLATMGGSFLTTLTILMIVFGAVFLYNIMEGTGLINQISHSLDDLHPAKEVRFFLLAICLTAFFEGVAGFGTPGAIVPLLLMAMGFNALLSVAVVLLFDGMFALFGAVGTPIITGLQLPLQLDQDQVQQIGLLGAVAAVVGEIIILFFIFRMFTKTHAPMEHRGTVLLLFSFFAIPFCVFAYFLTDLATILAALTMLVLSVLFLKTKEAKLDLWPWLPYVALAFLLLLPKVLLPLGTWLAWTLAFPDMLGTGISANFKPLLSPMIPFMVVGAGVAIFRKSSSWYVADSVRKVLQVLLVLFPSVAVAQLMINSGVEQPSMISNMAELLESLGDFYPVVAPFIGIIGAFVTGSTTISNVVFGASQLETAQALQLNPEVILALQLYGASVGNAVCLFNIIAAASVANLQNYREVLAKNMLPTLVAGLAAGLLGLLLLYLL